ncbi:MAG: hypothetical protein U1E78_05355 [Gammaproteobacteria bacterium]
MKEEILSDFGSFMKKSIVLLERVANQYSDSKSSKEFYNEIANIREYANRMASEGVSFEELTELPNKHSNFTEIVKKDKLYSLIPSPTPADSELYHQLYQLLNELQQGHETGIKFGLRGHAVSHGLSLLIPYSCRELMIKNLQDSFEKFSKLDFSESCIDFSMNLDDLNRNLAEINFNIQNAALKSKTISEIPSNKLSMMFHVTGHWVSIVGSADYIIHGDRFSGSILDPKGLSIFRAPSNETNEYSTDYAKKLLEISDGGMTVESLNRKLSHDLSLVKFIPLTLQKSDNCGWTSGSKTIMYSNAILVFDRYFKAQGIPEADAMERALDCSKKLYHLWTDFDRVQSLQSYLNLSNPDPVIVAKIYLQSKDKARNYRKEIKRIIDDSRIITEEILKEARDQMLKNIKVSLKTHRTDTSEHSKSYLELYLKSGTSAADALIYNYEKERCDNEKLIENIIRHQLFPRETLSVIKDQLISTYKAFNEQVRIKLDARRCEVQKVFSNAHIATIIASEGIDQFYNMSEDEIVRLSEISNTLIEDDMFLLFFEGFLEQNELKLMDFAKASKGTEDIKEILAMYRENDEIFDDNDSILAVVESKIRNTSRNDF